MADSEYEIHYGFGRIEEKVNEMFEDIKVERRLLFGRLRQENSKLNSEKKRKLRVLERRMNKAYKRLEIDNNAETFTAKQIELILKPWIKYQIELIYVRGDVFGSAKIQDEDGGATIHGMEWDNKEGGNHNDFERKVETNLTTLLQQLKKS